MSAIRPQRFIIRAVGKMLTTLHAISFSISELWSFQEQPGSNCFAYLTYF